MDAQIKPRQAVDAAAEALASSAHGLLARSHHSLRVARISYVLDLNEKGLSVDAQQLLDYQQEDGGWSDVEETLWCIKALKTFGGIFNGNISNAVKWIGSVQDSSGGWGLTKRDIPRIPTTSLTLMLLPELASKLAFSWLENEWTRDLRAEIKLTYKGGFTLMAFGRNSIQPQNPDLINQTIYYLSNEQNDDGGFGPWKNHPIGSDPWSTGITLVGLTSYPGLVDKKVIERAVEWLCKNQLPSGYWKYHFIDEGSAYAYWGLTEALKFLGEI